MTKRGGRGSKKEREGTEGVTKSGRRERGGGVTKEGGEGEGGWCNKKGGGRGVVVTKRGDGCGGNKEERGVW